MVSYCANHYRRAYVRVPLRKHKKKDVPLTISLNVTKTQSLVGT